MRKREKRRMKKAASAVLSAALVTGMTVTSVPQFGIISQAQEETDVNVENESAQTVTSLDGNVQADFWLDAEGTPFYSVTYKGKTVVEPSKLGFSIDFGDGAKEYSAGFDVIGIQSSDPVDTQWENPLGDQAVIPERYNETIMQLETEDGLRVDLIFRAYDEGAAVKYSFPQDADMQPFTIKEEYTYFNLDDLATAYVHKNRNQTEVIKTPVTELKAETAGYFRPMTVIGDGYAMTITEANQVDYTRVNFTVDEECEPGTIRTMFNGTTDNPDLNTENRTNDVTVDVREQAFDTSWRTFVLGDNEGQLVENNYLIKNLNPECAIEDTSWITPGLAFRSGLTTQAAKETIDYAAEHNITYVHFDAGWYGPEASMDSDPWKCIDGFDLDEISDYADQKGIKLMVYVNYRHLENEYNNGRLDDLFKMYVDQWGIDGIKFGFVPVGSQASTKMVYEWVKIAADNKLVVDIHDELVPTGFERTYPNLLTYEGIHGDEENPTPKDDLGYLFTRMVNGQADHTWCFSNNRNTTKAFRIAGSLVFYSPLVFTYWYDSASSVGEDEAAGMWDQMPTTWDESHMLESKIEEYATVSRRSGEDWYLASITAVDRTLSMPLSMLEDGVTYKAEMYANKENDERNVSVYSALVDSSDVLTIRMLENEGFSVQFTPATQEEMDSLPDYGELQTDVETVVGDIQALEDVTVHNLTEIEKTVADIRTAYDALSEVQKRGVTNLAKLQTAEQEIYRLRNHPAEMLYVNGEEVADFDPDQTEYTVNLLGGTELPHISCDTYEEGEIVSIEQVESIPGSAKVTVKNPFTEKTYTIHFTIPDSAAEIYAGDIADYTLDGRREYKIDRDRGNGVLTLYNESGETQTFEKGIGTHANTNIYYQMEGKGATRFQAKCGVSANNGNEANAVRFRVYKNERTEENLLFDSGNMTQKTPYKEIDVDVTGATQIILEANDGGDGINFDHANWCDAKFVLGEVFTTPIDSLIGTAQNLMSEVSAENQQVLETAVETAENAKTPESGELTYEIVYKAAIELRDVILQVKEQENPELVNLIAEAQNKQESDYTEESWKNFKTVLAQAENLLVDVNSSMSELDQVREDLQAALDGLTAIEQEELSTAVLEYALELAEKADTTGVVSSVVEKFDAAIAQAEDILARAEAGDTSVTQQMIDESWQNLVEIMQYLSFKQGDKTDLAKVIALAEDMNKDLSIYLDEGEEEFTTALEAAKVVYEDGDAMQEEVDTSWKTLLSAMSKLMRKPDKNALEELVQRAETFAEADYEAEGFAVLRTALASAKGVLENEQATAEEVERASGELQDAIAKLVPAEDAAQEKENITADASKTVTSGSDSKTDTANDNNANAAGDTDDSKAVSGAQKSAKTGDMAKPAMTAAAMAAALSAIALFCKHKKEEE